MRILFINNNGTGFADRIDVTDGTTVGELFEKMVGGSSEGYTIKLNRQPTTSGEALRDGDRLSVVPKKVEGAR